MTPEPESDLTWTAFLYVSGDLSPDEASAFERRLADDQEAREAVAGAVELLGALALVGPEPILKREPRKSPRHRRAFAVAASLAAAACVALAVIPSLRPANPTEATTSEVTLTWSDLQESADPEWLAFASVPAAPETPDPSPTVSVEIEAADESSADPALPSWLLAAASAPQGDTPPQEEN